MSLVEKFAHAAARNTTTYTAWIPNPRWISRQKTGCRKKSIQASQYRVGRYGWTTVAALSVTSTSLATSAASAPSAEPRAESVMVDRNSAIAATPSMETVMKAIAPAIRSVSWSRLSGAPDSDVTAPPAACPKKGDGEVGGAWPASPGMAAPPGPAAPSPGACPTAAAWDGPSRKTPVA